MKKPASYPKTDVSENRAVDILKYKLDGRRAKAYIKTRDKVPNFDGTIELVDDTGAPIGKVDVEPRHHKQRLIKAVAQDYPYANKILVNFPEHWELVQRIREEDSAVYVASMPPNIEVPYRDRFRSLPPEINESLDTYTHYKLFRPWFSPMLTISWDEATGVGKVESVDSINVQLQQVGQAQVWKGASFAVLWECYVFGASQGCGVGETAVT